MTLHAPRRAALLGMATATAVLAGALVALSASPAQAAAITNAEPRAASNTSGTVNVTFTTTTPFPTAGNPGTGTQVELVRTGTTGTTAEDRIIGDVVDATPPTPGNRITAAFTFAGTTTVAPPNPGAYDVFVFVQDRRTGDTCTGCFSLFSAAPTVTDVNVAALPTGVQGQIFRVTGTGFAKDTTVQAVFPGTTRVDPAISFTAALGAPNQLQQRSAIPNSPTTLSRTIRVDALAAVGPRDLLVSNTDADPQTGVGVARLAGGFRVLGFDIDRVSPDAAANDAVQQLAVLGRGLPVGASVRLVNEATPTVGTLVGTSVDRVSAERLSARFDLRDAVPGNYRVEVSSGQDVSAPECSPTFTIVNVQSPAPSGRASTVASDFSCGSATAAVTPSPSATPTSTASASPSPRPSGSASPSASPTSGSTRQASISVTPSTITSQETALVRGSVTPGSVVELLAYSRPSTTYRVVRRGVVGESGVIEFRVGPSGNTRMFLRASNADGGDTVESASIVLTVRTSINLKVARTGTLTYRFTGSTLPKRRGQLVTVFYEGANGSRTIASRARVGSDGTYDVTRRFTGRGTFTFFTGTGTDINNASNNSNRVRVTLR